MDLFSNRHTTDGGVFFYSLANELIISARSSQKGVHCTYVSIFQRYALQFRFVDGIARVAKEIELLLPLLTVLNLLFDANSCNLSAVQT